LAKVAFFRTASAPLDHIFVVHDDRRMTGQPDRCTLRAFYPNEKKERMQCRNVNQFLSAIVTDSGKIEIALAKGATMLAKRRFVGWILLENLGDFVKR
jgi:hypothetical protein